MHASLLRKTAYLPDATGLSAGQKTDKTVSLWSGAQLTEYPGKDLGSGIGERGWGRRKEFGLSVTEGEMLLAQIFFQEHRFARGLRFDNALYAADAHSQEWLMDTWVAVCLAQREGYTTFPAHFRLLSIESLRISPQARGQLVWTDPLKRALGFFASRSVKNGVDWLSYQPIVLMPEGLSHKRHQQVAGIIQTPRRQTALARLYSRHIGADLQIRGQDNDMWLARRL